MNRCRVPAVLVALALAACSPGEQDFYGLEMSGHLVGYAVVTTTFDGDGVTLEQVSKETYLKLTLLGRPVDVRSYEHWKFDPGSPRPRSYEISMSAGPDMKVSAAWTFEGERAHFRPRTGGRDSTFILEGDVIVDDGKTFSVVAGKPLSHPGAKKTVRQLDLLRGVIRDIECTRRDDEHLVFEGQEFDCAVYDVFDRGLGSLTRVWIDGQDELVKLEGADGTVAARAGRNIRGRIRRASIDDQIFANVDERIEEPLRSLEVEATIRSAGQLLTAEGLNVAGQRFTGTVDRNLIDGVFELERTSYDGEGAPPFPTEPPDDALRRWLRPEILIESDDPVLVDAARSITAGSNDAWDAVVRIGRWIDENLHDSIPGGSARQTFDSRKGECASHARLTAALCRASGIPCRVVSGCMYTLIREGSFGQHVWNEVYMGEAGWIALDTTVDEIGSINAGHVRLGEQVSFQPVRMEIRSFTTETAQPAPEGPGR